MKENFSTYSKKLFMLGAVFGLITGIVEGLLLFGLHQTGWLTWRLQNRAIWYETLWIAPLVDLVLFTMAGGFFALLGWMFPRLPVKNVRKDLFGCNRHPCNRDQLSNFYNCCEA